MVLSNGKTKIGVFHIPNRKKPCLGIENGNELKIYGTFKNEMMAMLFMERLSEFVGARSSNEV